MKTQRYFTLVEFLIIISVIFVLIVLGVINFRLFQKEFILQNTSEEIINVLRLAQSKTLASEGANNWGVYFETSTSPHQYILFKGERFALRDASSDEVHKLPNSVEIYEINLGGGNEVLFERVSGTVSSTSPFGKVSIRIKNDPLKTKEIFIENSGLVSLANPSTSSDQNRLKDSRHVHFDYSRPISTSTEKLILTFTSDASTISQEIPIADNLKDGQIYWEGEVNVEGSIQKLKIHTHRLNDPFLDTQFCIHRDRRYNNKALKVEISGDSGDLIRYDASGQTQKGNSIYVSEPLWQ